jgi:hypothetical protein
MCEMGMRGLAIATLLLAASLSAAAAGLAWRAVPGAPELEVDLASVQVDQGVVSAWVRTGLAGTRARAVTHTEFDCRQRTVRTVASQWFGAGGTPLAMSSVPGAARPLGRDEDLAWAYDALCELARQRL